MEIDSIISALESSAPGEWMRNNLLAMPLVESTHVLAVALVFGTIVFVDLRLLGLFNTGKSYLKLHHDLVRWTWIGFGIAVVTGVLMILPNAATYYRNVPFWWKMGALLCAGINMAVFEGVTSRNVESWGNGKSIPAAGRVAGALSIFFWLGVVFFGRWIGFTKGYDFEIPEDIDFDFSDVGILMLPDLSSLC